MRLRRWVLAWVLLAGASLGAKIAFIGFSEWKSEERADHRLIAFLEEEGWLLRGSYEVMPEQRMLIFTAIGCDRPVEAMRVAPNGELFAVLEAMRAPDYRLLYVEDGLVKDTPSRIGYLRTRIRSAAAQLGLRAEPSLDLAAILEPVECDVVTRMGWSKLGQT